MGNGNGLPEDWDTMTPAERDAWLAEQSGEALDELLNPIGLEFEEGDSDAWTSMDNIDAWSAAQDIIDEEVFPSDPPLADEWSEVDTDPPDDDSSWLDDPFGEDPPPPEPPPDPPPEPPPPPPEPPPDTNEPEFENPEDFTHFDPSTDDQTIEEMYEDALDTFSDVQEDAAEEAIFGEDGFAPGVPGSPEFLEWQAAQQSEMDAAAQQAADDAAAASEADWLEKAAEDPNFIPFAPGTPEFEAWQAAQNQAAADDALTKAKESHAFWTLPNAQYDPKLQFRFRVEIGGMGLEDARDNDAIRDSFADGEDDSHGHVWYAKSIDKPGFSVIDIAKDTWFNSRMQADPLLTVDRLTYKPITMTLIDPSYPNATRKLVRFLRRSGFNENKAYEIAEAAGGATQSYVNTTGFVRIFQLDADGQTIETWDLIRAYPMEVDFGKLDYSSNDPVEITVKWGYKTFKVDFPTIGKETHYDYFRDDKPIPTSVVQATCGKTLRCYWDKASEGEKNAFKNASGEPDIKKFFLAEGCTQDPPASGDVNCPD